jgi:hypothetical protein
MPLGLTIFTSLLLLYIAISRHRYVAYDAASMAAVTHNLVNHLTMKTTGAFNDVFGISTPYSPYGVGLSAALVPFYSISKLLGHQDLWESLLNPILVAGSATVQYRITRALHWKQLPSVLAALAYGSLTMALQATTELFSEPGVAFFETLMVLAIVRWKDDWRWSPALLGVALAMVFQFRADSVLTVSIGLIALPLFTPLRRMLTVGNVLWVATPVFASLAFLLWYNQVRFGTPFVTSYGGQGFGTPILTGLRGLLLSPSRGLFVFNLIAVPGTIGLAWMLWQREPFGVLATLLLLPRLLVFAKWTAWEGGISWGPRFLMPSMFLLVISAFYLLEFARRRLSLVWLTRILLTLIALASVPVSYLSVRVPYEQWNNQLVHFLPAHSLGGGAPRQAFQSEIWTVSASQLRGDILLLRKGVAQMSPALWRTHLQWVGWLLLAGFGVCAVTAIGVAARADNRDLRRAPLREKVVGQC